MKTSKLQRLAWVFFALALTTTTVLAQGRGNGNRRFQNQNEACLYNISELSEKQEKQISEMEETHQEEMTELRTKRQSTANAIEKSEIRTEMLKRVEAHRNSVKKVLTDDQQKQYDQFHAFGNKQRNQQFANGRSNRNFAGYGNGNGQFARGNRGRTCYANTNFSGRGTNFQNSNRRGNGNKVFYSNSGNNFRGRNANFGRGYGRYNNPNNNLRGNRNINSEGLEIVE